MIHPLFNFFLSLNHLWQAACRDLRVMGLRVMIFSHKFPIKKYYSGEKSFCQVETELPSPMAAGDISNAKKSPNWSKKWSCCTAALAGARLSPALHLT